MIARPLELGGLGITDLHTAGLALKLRWLWLKRTDRNRPWSALPLECKKEVQAMFDASIEIMVGDGNDTCFWTDQWLNGSSILLLAPDLCQTVGKRVLKRRTVREALQNSQ